MEAKDKKPENPYVYAMCDDGVRVQHGITLRDDLAAKAMQAMIQSEEIRKLCAIKGESTGTDWMDVLAGNAFCMADCMLKQREL